MKAKCKVKKMTQKGQNLFIRGCICDQIQVKGVCLIFLSKAAVDIDYHQLPEISQKLEVFLSVLFIFFNYSGCNFWNTTSGYITFLESGAPL